MKNDDGDRDRERKIFEKYIKPQITILNRIKRRIFGPRKRIKTLDDVIMLDYDLLIKLFCILMIYMIIRIVIIGALDIWLFFNPRSEPIPDPFFHQILYRIRGLIYS